MINQWIEQLRSPDAQERRQAIIALANARDPGALEPLAAVYREDSDLELRQLARNAGRFIRQETNPSGAEQAAPSSDAFSDNTGAVTHTDGISKRDRELGQFYLDTAMNYQTLGDRGRAVEHLGKALSLNPGMAKETFVANLILLVTGMAADEALPTLLHPDRREELIAKVGGRHQLERKTKDAGIEKATWENIALDFLVYWLVISVCLAAIFVLVLSQLQDILNDALVSSPSGSNIDFDTLLTASIVSLMIAALFYGIVNTISMAIQGGAIHLAATFIFGGDNSLRYLYRRLVPFQTWVIFGMTAGFIVLMLFGNATDAYFLMPMLMIAASIGVFWYTVDLISKVYHFGWMSGCGTVLVVGIVLAVLSCGANSVLMTVMNALLGGS